MVGVGAAGSSAVWSVAGSSDGGFAHSSDGGAQGGGTCDKNVCAGKEFKQRVMDWRLTTSSKTKVKLWQKSCFNVYGGKNMTDVTICSLWVREEA